MYSCVHLSIKEHQFYNPEKFYKSIELYPWYITLEKVLNKFERIWNEHIWTSSEQVWTHFNTFERVLNKFGHIWTHVNKFWTSLKTNEHIWTHIITLEQVLNKFEHKWTHLNIFELIWTSEDDLMLHFRQELQTREGGCYQMNRTWLWGILQDLRHQVQAKLFSYRIT